MDRNRTFIRIPRKAPEYRPVNLRVEDYNQVIVMPSQQDSIQQSSRCMDCGTPFCHDGCPIGNYIPEWNNLMSLSKWDKALKLLHAANPLPEVTGRVCPALCEYACVLGINDEAVSIRENELSIVEFGFKNNLIKPEGTKIKTGKKVAVVGSGPAGLTCAQRLNSVGHSVTVFEKDKKIGGLLRYGIPDFKLEKDILDRRLRIWEKEGLVFKPGVCAGRAQKPEVFFKGFDAICLACGCRVPRDINVPGRNLKGIYFAMDYLSQANKEVSGENIEADVINAGGKKVVVIGGGDTGSDCVGTAKRQGAKSILQIEIMPMPPLCRSQEQPWPKYPMLLKNSSSHEEGCQRQWCITTKAFIGDKQGVKRLLCEKTASDKKAPASREGRDTDFEIEADLVLIAAGFVSPEQSGLAGFSGLEVDGRGNIKTGINYMTTKKGVFCAGDARRGQSLVVWAIAEGINCAYYIDKYLMGESSLTLL
jgi:glutamate synthase (NADPH) small chain